MTLKSIHNAKLDKITDISPTAAEFVIKPLYYGYGNTMGNSLRRVLLSSIRGSAITAYSIDGVSHEYASIPGIREDSLDIALNLKNIRVKSYEEEPVELTLSITGAEQTADKHGDLRVTAGDIKLPSSVEIANPNQVICHIDDPKTKLTMHFLVEQGVGYLSLEKSVESRTRSDMIALDAVFTPVLRVRYSVENTRVGRDTNLQKLTLYVETDGTLQPREAFEEAAAILVNQYTALAGATTIEAGAMPGTETEEEDENYLIPIEDLGLSARTANALTSNGVKTVKDLVMLSEAELKDLKGFGDKAFAEVKAKLTELNI